MATQPSACCTVLQKGSESSHFSNGEVPTLPVDQGADSIRPSPLLASMLSKERQQVVQAAHIRKFSKDQTIHMQGEPVRQILLLGIGYVKLSQVCQNGNEVIVRLCGPGEVVGPIAMPAHDRVHNATAQVLQPCEALIWPVGTFELLSQRFPRLKLNSLLILDGQLREMEERFSEISTQQVPSRLSRQLLRLLNQVGDHDGGVTQIRISQEELAQMIGTTFHTVSRVLSEWEHKGIVKRRREKVSIQNAHALRNLYGGVYSQFDQATR